MFGSYDMLVSAVGVVTAAVLAGYDVFVVGLTLSLCSAMAAMAGEWLDSAWGHRTIAIGIVVFLACVVSIAPTMLGSAAGTVLVALTIALVVAKTRPGPRRYTYSMTYIVLALASALSAGAAVLGQALA